MSPLPPIHPATSLPILYYPKLYIVSRQLQCRGETIMGAAKDKWIRKWGTWNSKAQSILERNARECDTLDGLDKMECIDDKNKATVTKSALGLGPV